MQRLKNNDRGQSGTIVAILLVPLMAILALALDVGAMHLDKQQLQTGADAGALAIAQDCAYDNCSTEDSTADTMAEANFHGTGVDTVTELNRTERTVTVRTSAVREHWFAPIIGINSTQIHATASAKWSEPTGAAGFFPLAFSTCALDDAAVSTEIIIDENCTIEGKDKVPGGFGWLALSGDTCGEFTWPADGWVRSDPGKSLPDVCKKTDFSDYIGQTILLPIFGATNDRGGANAKYRITEFVELTLTGYNFPTNGSSDPNPCEKSGPCVRGTYERLVPFSEASSGITAARAAAVTLTE